MSNYEEHMKKAWEAMHKLADEGLHRNETSPELIIYRGGGFEFILEEGATQFGPDTCFIRDIGEQSNSVH